MNVVFVYAAAPSGHTRAARAIQEALGLRRPGTAFGHYEMKKDLWPVLGPWVAAAYQRTLRLAPWLWEWAYDRPALEPVSLWGESAWAALAGEARYRALEALRPDVLVATQGAAARFLAGAKRRRPALRDVPLAVVLTDFTAHLYWRADEIDLYLASSEEAAARLRELSPGADIRVTGIPIGREFRDAPTPTEARLRLGFDPERPTFLLSGGTKGFGPLERLTRLLRREIPHAQIIVECGLNERLRRRLRDLDGDPAVHIYGFQRHIADLLAAADAVVGKPGGLTVSEAQALGVPFVVVDPLPGQETRNARHLRAAGCALFARSDAQTVGALRRLLDPGAHAAARAKALAAARPDAADACARAILDKIGRINALRFGV